MGYGEAEIPLFTYAAQRGTRRVVVDDLQGVDGLNNSVGIAKDL